MILDSYGKKFLKKMAEALFLTLAEEIPGVGGIIRFGRRCGQVLKDLQETIPQQEQRIVQLEQAAVCSPADAQQIAVEVMVELRQAGQVVSAEQAAVAQELMAITPMRIRECTQATLDNAKRLGTAAVTVLPVTAQFNTADREAFYSSLFPQRRPFHVGYELMTEDPKSGLLVGIGWLLERPLGVGGFGEVWLAHNKSMPSLKWAVKFCQDADNSNMLKGEAKRLVAIQQQLPAGTAHIVALLNLNLTKTPYWLAFEYVDGGTLEKRMSLGAMDWPTAWELYRPLLQGMAHVHELGIVHRDLKPANILLAGGTVPRIADLGIGKVLADKNAQTRRDRSKSHLTTAGAGTFGYMSPEQEEGQEAHRADDVYALGVILWQMLAGSLKPLRFERDANKINASDIVKDVIRDSVFVPREERIASARGLLDRLTPKPTILTVAPHGGQYTSINAALAVIAPGGTIYVKPGTYRESLRLSQSVSIIGDGPQQNIIIEGAEASCIVMDTATATVRNLTLRGLADAKYAVDIPIGELVMEDCDISSDNTDGSGVGIHGDNAKPILRRCVIHDGKDTGVYVLDNGSGLLEQCDIYHNKLAGLYIESGGNPTVRNCKIHDGKDAGVYVLDNGIGLLEQCDIYGNESHGLYIETDGNPTVRNCKIHDGKDAGVYVLDNGSGLLEQCDIYGNESDGLHIETGGNPTVRNCKIHDGKNAGVYVLDNGSGLLEQCDIYQNKLAGLYIESGGNPTVRNCKIHDGKDAGVYVLKNGSGTFDNCELRGNKNRNWFIMPGCQVTRRNNRE